ncbi:hypothetical protein [Endozoicomonas montiporae]|uniref:Lipoprotein n=1 Tax=Endozoicomonas montiporae CL-33 TaxID=570277 RepID=A0A142BA05_9GAMM|nr:hypothetical protein [Endozoicomonas montiporae]AMO55581.1 hypothetical protein EZMO1_1393 [Endozoicomonas montiporae CL-33]
MRKYLPLLIVVAIVGCNSGSSKDSPSEPPSSGIDGNVSAGEELHHDAQNQEVILNPSTVGGKLTISNAQSVSVSSLTVNNTGTLTIN